ncbi:MAG: IS481 family transposase, partial [Geodermatophilaceae bacterium]|nr:IS481 family transposase [Geodermatophilaceae bacterium]
MAEQIRQLRIELSRQGLDAGPVSIAAHLSRHGALMPSTSTIRRILHAAALIAATIKAAPPDTPT